MAKNPIAKLFSALEKRYQMTPDFAQRSILIYGAGGVGKDVFRVLVRHGYNVRGFLDQKAGAGDSWNGVPILAPAADSISVNDRKSCQVVIAIFNRDVEIPPIVNRLNVLGYRNVLTFLDVVEMFPTEGLQRFWIANKGFYIGKESLVEEVYHAWDDSKSRELYLALLKLRLENDFSALPPPDVKNQYFPEDIPWARKRQRFVDCGAFDGDTLAYMLANKIEMEALAAFEPDNRNFSLLAMYIKRERDYFPNDSWLFPCGVHSNNNLLRFAAGQGEGSYLSAEGNTVIQCVALDDAISGFQPTMIKMDIEGAELDALRGSHELMAKNNPALSICLYHSPEHLWQIPLYVKNMTDGGKFYLRSHGCNGLELVMYRC